MTRNKRFSVALVVLMLVVASGSVLALSAGADTGASTNEQLAQEDTPTEEENATETPEDEENVTADEPEEAENETEAGVDETETGVEPTEAEEDETDVEADENETEAGVETPAEPDVQTPNELVFQVEQLQIDEWSFVVGDDVEPDRTETVENVELRDQEVRLDVTELLTDENALEEALGAEAEQDVDESVDAAEGADVDVEDVETVQFVIRNVNVENVTLVLEMPDEQEMEMLREQAEEQETPTPVETPEVGEETDVETPDQFFFVIERLAIDEWSFVVGDDTEPDTTERVGDVELSDRNFTATSTELEQVMQMLAMQQQAAQPAEEPAETPEQVGDDDLETTRIVVENVIVENVTFGVVETEMVGPEETGPPEDVETGPPEDVEPGQAGGQVDLSDQSSDGQTVTVDRVTVSQGGFVTIHDSSLLEGDAFGSAIGTSEYLEQGTHRDVEVTLDEPLEADERLIAMAHLDTNDNQQYDFVESEGQEDAPYIRGNQPIVDDAQVTVDEAAGGEAGADEADEEADEEAETETEAGADDTEDSESGDEETEALTETEGDETAGSFAAPV